MRQHYAPHNRSEGSHRRTDGHILFTLVVGYFAALNMTIGIKDVTAFAVAYFFILLFFY